jgi:fibronectin-binding autotransporter adhesin
VTNTGTGSVISCKYSGVYGVKTTTVTNQGSIASSADVGALFGGGGRLANTGTAASISGANYGVLARYAAFTVTNTGRITGTAESGVAINDGGSVTNAAGAHITGGTVGVQGAGIAISVNNAGTIAATGTASSASISSTAARWSTAAASPAHRKVCARQPRPR